MVLGERYTALSWYLNQANPCPAVCKAVREECKANALELEGGTLHTLDLHGYTAAPPQQPRELLPGRHNLLRTLMATPIKTEKKTVMLRRAGEHLQKDGRQVLWRVQDLHSCAGEAGPAVKKRRRA